MSSMIVVLSGNSITLYKPSQQTPIYKFHTMMYHRVASINSWRYSVDFNGDLNEWLYENVVFSNYHKVYW